ncbi:hypothetical protein DFJ43DRAFT_1149611 [Lentinula guzmanii]|uniref:Uncharacterized protein n=1 Tax=Lentinula guzmanii TaxID=2804957 RepID=A0AA38JR30_9AGAR|nr:hypothetical protein DFJ43DRAFT_1149611 [Lentinula guzmanii]
MDSKEILVPTVPPALSAVPTASNMRRRSARRPLKSSPLTGPALSSEGAIIQDDHIQGRPKPSRISSLPEFSSKLSDQWVESLLPVSATEPNQRNPSPTGHLTKSISTHSLTQPSSFYPSRRSRPSSRETTHPLPPTLSQNSPRAPHRNSSPLHDAGGKWLITNTYQETPRFSRLSKGSGSNVVMPVSVKEHRRKSQSLASVKSQPNLRGRSVTGTCNSHSGEGGKTIQPRRSFSSLTSKVRQRARAFASFDTDATMSDANDAYRSHSRSSSSEDNSDVNSFTSSAPSLPPSSAHSHETPTSNLVNVDEDTEVTRPNSVERQLMETWDRQRSGSNASSTDSRDSSFGALKSRTKVALRMSRSFVHSRAPSSADPILSSTVSPTFGIPRKHVKGFSFLSFTSSDDSHSFHVPPVPSLPDAIGITTISDTSSTSDSDLATDDTFIDYQKEAKQLLYDAFPRPPSLHHDAIPSIFPASLSDDYPSEIDSPSGHTLAKSSTPVLKARSTGAPLRTPISVKPLSGSQPPKSIVFYAVPSPTPASPHTPPFSPSRSDKFDQILPPNPGLKLAGRPYVSTLDLSSPSFFDSPSTSFLSIGDDDDDVDKSKVHGTTSVKAKAQNLSGVLDETGGGRNNSKGHPDHEKTAPKTVGTMKKLWKNLRGGEKDSGKLRV